MGLVAKDARRIRGPAAVQPFSHQVAGKTESHGHMSNDAATTTVNAVTICDCKLYRQLVTKTMDPQQSQVCQSPAFSLTGQAEILPLSELVSANGRISNRDQSMSLLEVHY
jgi:hypothetical protein